MVVSSSVTDGQTGNALLPFSGSFFRGEGGSEKVSH